MASAEATFCRDEIIRGNLDAHRLYIEQCIKAIDLLKLPFYSKEQKKEILNSHLPNVQQVRRGLDILHNEISDPGKYAAFQDLMAGENGYPKIAKILNGVIVASDEHYRKLVDLFSCEIIKRMSPMDLLPHLQAKETITDEDAHTVRAQFANYGPVLACWELIFVLHSRKEDWFKDLMVSLIEAGTPDIAEILEPDMFSKIMAQRPPSSKENVDIVSFFSTHEVDKDCTGDENECERMETTYLKARGAENETSNILQSEGPNPFDCDIDALLFGGNLKDYDRDFDAMASPVVAMTNSRTEPQVLKKAQEPDPELARNIPHEAVSDGAIGMDTFRAEIDKLLHKRDASASGPDKENDLNAQSSAKDDLDEEDEKEINIDTDVNEIDTRNEDKDIELFEYQKELAREGCDGENVVIMAPTNSGKTYVGSRIMQVHLRRQKKQGRLARVIFLVENEALAFQQGKLFAEKLPAYRTKVFTGSVQRGKQQYLYDFLASRDILVATAQILVNALKTGNIHSLTQFSLIMFDECHHSNKQHMFNEILWRYIDMKLQPGTDAASMPQVVGLTASLGVGGSTDPAMGLKHMKSILANMDAKFLCTVRYAENKRELLKHTNCPIEEPVPVPHRVNDRFREAVIGVVRQIDNHILESCNILDDATMAKCRIPLAHFGTERYSQWNAEFVKNTMPGIRIDPVRRILNPCRLHLEAYNKALMIHQDARIIDAIRLLKECMDKLRRPDIHDTDATLVKLYDGLSDSFVDQPENPKLVKMGEILQDVLVADENARGIIFVKTRELAKALVRWINESNTLTILNAWEFVGKNAATSKGGMTKYKQMNVLKYFDDGRHRVIVATSVAEEGLDIRKCNLVIRYEHVTNEIVRLQSRGRARADFSRYLVISSDPAILEKEEKNRRCEELMNRIVPQLQEFIDANGNLWEKELLQIQKEMKEQRAREKENKRRNMLGDLEFQCLNCGAYICLSSDIKCFNKDHHIITHPDINERIRMESGFVNFQEPEGMEYGGQIFCAEITCQKNLGSICTLKNAEFPLVTLKAFRVVKPDGTGRSYKRWKEVPCEIAEITVDGLSDAVDARLNYLV